MKEEPTKRKKPTRKIQIPRRVTLARRLRLGSPTGKELETALKTLRTGVYPTISSSNKESSDEG